MTPDARGSSSGPRPVASPVASERIHSIDVLRGFAILGIFVMHVPAMGLSPVVVEAARLGTSTVTDAIGSALVLSFFELKFWALFSILFGAGVMLQSRRAEERGDRYGPVFRRRMLWLAGFGLLHGMFLFPFEVLFVYGVLAFVLYPLRRLSPRAKLTVGISLLVCLPAMSLLLDAIPEEEPSSPIEIANPRSLDFGELLDLLLLDDPRALARVTEEAALGGSVDFSLRFRRAYYSVWLLLCGLFLNVRVLALFFIGAALLELGFFHRDRAPLHRRLLLIAGLVGLPLEKTYGTGAIWAGPTLFSYLEAAHYLSSIVLALGFASGMNLLVHSGRFTGVMAGLANVGRTALSNYVLQSVLLNALFWWWGFGLWGRFCFLQCIAIAFVVFAGQMWLSTVWLRTFRMGPLEWLWRMASRRARLPLRR